jgi:hypothetical protein
LFGALEYRKKETSKKKIKISKNWQWNVKKCLKIDIQISKM